MTPDEFEKMSPDAAMALVKERMAEAHALLRRQEIAMWEEFFRNLTLD